MLKMIIETWWRDEKEEERDDEGLEGIDKGTQDGGEQEYYGRTKGIQKSQD